MRSIKAWLNQHSLITYKQYLRDILGIVILLTIIYGYITIKYSKLLEVKHETNIISIMEGRQKVMLNAINDYYTGDVSNEFKRAQYITETKANVFTAIEAVNRFMPGIMGDDHPFTVFDVLAIIMTESRFDPDAVSSKDAMGIMQIMEHKKYITSVDGVNSPFDINCSVKAGLECLKRKYDLFGDKKKSIIAYWGIVERKDGSWKDKYYNKVMENKEIIMKILEDKK